MSAQRDAVTDVVYDYLQLNVKAISGTGLAVHASRIADAVLAVVKQTRALEDDPNVAEGSLVATEVTVTQYIRPDTTVGIRTHYTGDGSLSQILGLLAMAAIDIYDRSNRPEPEGRNL